MEDKKINEEINELALTYYSRRDIQETIYEFCKSRETIARYKESFGKRPSTIEYPNEILQEAKNGATSFHCSEELWENPLELTTEMTRKQLDELRGGWDLLIDIDSKYIEYSKIMTELIIEALNFHGIKNIGIKFSGNRGFHIIIPWKAFPKEINRIETRTMFPEWARAICSYLAEFTKQNLIDKISELFTNKSYIKDKEGASKVIPDIVLVSPRHLFRTPYSLHEKTLLSSVVIDKKILKDFEPKHAEPLKIFKTKNFIPDVHNEEARELLLQALDWQQSAKKSEKKEKREYEKVEIDKSSIIMPPCISKIMTGLEDGRKRALFILTNYFNSLNFSKEEITKKINEWNSRNKKPIRQGYVDSQLKYYLSRKIVLPPNCDKNYYKDINVCNPDEFCKKIKNPVNYTILKSKITRKNK